MPKKLKARRLDPTAPENLIDRELSWLAFNDRVIEEAEDETTPLLERLRFLGIASSNMDEFFMVRVSGVQEQVEAKVQTRNQAGHTPEEHFRLVHEAAHRQVDRQYSCLQQKVLPALAREKIVLRRVSELARGQRRFARQHFDQAVFPVLTPLAVDSGHPFPFLRNLSLNLAVRLSAPKDSHHAGDLFAVVPVPSVLARIVRLPESEEGSYEFILLEDLISQNIRLLFPGLRVLEVAAFRLIRDADIEFAEEEAEDLLKTIEIELRQRERGHAVRLGVEKKASHALVAALGRAIGMTELQTYLLDGPINLGEFSQIANIVDRPDLKHKTFVPSTREPLRSEKNIFEAIARRDIMVHHPYESFIPVEEFVQHAARDPNVLAIKQTLYRTSGDSPITRALMEAAENGKQVAALVELKARFDEERNIVWARRMERAGVHVVYGLIGLKTHAKICLVVRREEGGIRRYVHLGTGNYNPNTARVYTDLGLFSCDPDLCDDATELFNLLTGYSRIAQWKKMKVAPVTMRPAILALIQGEIDKAQAGGVGRIRAKMNSLIDPGTIAKLYEASCAGVKINLIIRGVCGVRPGIPGLSENITVSSIVDRFLEHSRIYIFGEGEDERVFLSSGDWMPRNLDRRVEIVFPIEDPEIRRRVVDEVYGLASRDNVKRRLLQPDGRYTRIVRGPNEEPLRSQQALLKLEEELREHDQATDGEHKPLPPIRPIIPAGRVLRAKSSSIIQETTKVTAPTTAKNTARSGRQAAKSRRKA